MKLAKQPIDPDAKEIYSATVEQGRRLVRAFLLIEDAALRREIVNLVEVQSTTQGVALRRQSTGT